MKPLSCCVQCSCHVQLILCLCPALCSVQVPCAVATVIMKPQSYVHCCCVVGTRLIIKHFSCLVFSCCVLYIFCDNDAFALSHVHHCCHGPLIYCCNKAFVLSSVHHCCHVPLRYCCNKSLCAVCSSLLSRALDILL